MNSFSIYMVCQLIKMAYSYSIPYICYATLNSFLGSSVQTKDIMSEKIAECYLRDSSRQ